MRKLVRVLEILKNNNYKPYYGVEHDTTTEGQKKYSTSLSFDKNAIIFTFDAYSHGWDHPFADAISKEKLWIATDGFAPAKRTFEVRLKDSQVTDEGLRKLIEEHKKTGNLESDIHLYLAKLVS